jgi:hypothetical protein
MELYYLVVLILILIGCFLLYTYVIYPLMHPLDSLNKIGDKVDKVISNAAQNILDGTGPTSGLTQLALGGSTSYKDYLETKAFGPDFQNALNGTGKILKEGDICTVENNTTTNYGKLRGTIQGGKCVWNGICMSDTRKENDKCISNDYGKECTQLFMGDSPGKLQKYSETGICVDTGDCKPNFEKINNVCLYKDKCKICRTDESGIIYKYNRYGKCPTTALFGDPDIETECLPEFPGPKSQKDCSYQFTFVSGNPSKCIFTDKNKSCKTIDNFKGTFSELGDCIKNSDNQCFSTDYNLVNGQCILKPQGCSFTDATGKLNPNGKNVDIYGMIVCVEDKCKTRPNEYETVNKECLYKNRNKPCEADLFGSKVPGTYSNDGECFRNGGGIIGV